MNELEKLYADYDRTRPAQNLFTAAKYGFEWSPENGFIFYPANYLSRSRSELLGYVNKDIPTRVCPEINSNDDSDNPVARAAHELPDALLVMCGAQDWAERALPGLATHVPAHMLARCITHRQLGDFLSYGGKATKLWDVFRKSSLPAAARTRPKVSAAFNLFNEGLSRATFLAILRRYLLSSDAMIPYFKASEQYFAPIYKHLDNEVFIDCGGYTGDTLEEYLKLKNGAQLEEYILFEPDSQNFHTLLNYIASLPLDIKSKISAHKLAVGQENSIFNFTGGEGPLSYITKDGDCEVSCVAMDEFLAGKSPTFIKMDLQGHEAFALYGGKEIIARHHPVLAISVYHLVQDLWELPLLIKRFYPEYEFYLRAYRPEEEYICYAVPKSRTINS